MLTPQSPTSPVSIGTRPKKIRTCYQRFVLKLKNGVRVIRKLVAIRNIRQNLSIKNRICGHKRYIDALRDFTF